MILESPLVAAPGDFTTLSRRPQEAPGEALGDQEGSEAEELQYILGKLTHYDQKHRLCAAFGIMLVKTANHLA